MIKDTVTVTVLLSKTQRTCNQKRKVYYFHHSEKKQNKTEYNETHREEKRERDNEYRENNRDILHATKLELIICECGCQSVRSSIDRHGKSELKKRIELMNRNKMKHTNKKNMNHNRKKNKLKYIGSNVCL